MLCVFNLNNSYVSLVGGFRLYKWGTGGGGFIIIFVIYDIFVGMCLFLLENYCN